ncbi:MAG: hypothetical protein HY074_05400 [Deltaproteobacteria bacterium]|nr:hypothetical protein [Deltaproteobacteria bacterium]
MKKILLGIGTMTMLLVSASVARAQSVGNGLVKVNDKLLLSELLGVPDPVSRDNPKHHGIQLKIPVSVSINAELGSLGGASDHSSNMLYFANGKIQNTAPGWTSWCSAWRNSEGAPPSEVLSGILPANVHGGEGMVSVLGRKLSEACWTVLRPAADGPAALVDLHLGGGTNWVIDCHHIQPDIRVGELRKIFGQHRIVLAVPETAAGLAAAQSAPVVYETAARKPASLTGSNNTVADDGNAESSDDTPCVDCDSKTVSFAHGADSGASRKAEKSVAEPVQMLPQLGRPGISGQGYK